MSLKTVVTTNFGLEVEIMPFICPHTEKRANLAVMFLDRHNILLLQMEQGAK